MTKESRTVVREMIRVLESEYGWEISGRGMFPTGSEAALERLDKERNWEKLDTWLDEQKERRAERTRQGEEAVEAAYKSAMAKIGWEVE